MGGLFMIVAVVLVAAVTLLVKDYSVQVILMACILFGIIGAIDDYGKIALYRGLSARSKFLLQWVSAFFITQLLVCYTGTTTELFVPFTEISLPIGFLYYLWAPFIIVACSNAVNLTDGLDGLAASCLIPQFLLYGIITSCMSYSISALSYAIAGSLTGFLWYNRFPARVFMGDVGSLAWGAVFAVIALITKNELIIPIIGIVFVVENSSVMMQVAWFKKYKQKLFKMAPLHHHFELSGWKEQNITLLFGFVSVVCCILVSVFFLCKSLSKN